MLATRPRTSRSRSCASIAASRRARRPWRSAGPSGTGSVAIGVVRVVGEADTAVLRDDVDVLRPVAAVALVPHDRFDHEDGAGGEDVAPVVAVTEVGPHVGRLRALEAEAVPEVEVRHPGLLTTAHLLRGRRQVRGRDAGPHDLAHRGVDLEPAPVLGLLASGRLLPDHPGAAEV